MRELYGLTYLLTDEFAKFHFVHYGEYWCEK